MKKLIGALALAAMVATSAFAEVSFGAWICNLPTLVAYDGEDIKAGGVANPWGGWRPVRFSVSWTADDGKAGMTMGVYNDAKNGLGAADAADFWIKPVDAVKITVGQMDNSFGLRGDLCFGSWDWLRPNNWLYGGEGLTFSSYDENGLGIELTPVEGLKVALAMPLNTTAPDAYKAFGNSNIAAAYTIDGIGTIKAGFDGQYAADGDAKKYGTIEGAFDLTGIDKLYVTVGAAFTLANSDYWDGAKAKDYATWYAKQTWKDETDEQKAAKYADYVYGNIIGNTMLKAALGVSYGITESFKLSADFALGLFNDKIADDPAISFGVGASYGVTDALTVVGDVRMLLPNNDCDPTLSFLVGLNGSVGSNAQLGIGFQGIVGLGDAAYGNNGLQVVKPTAYDKFVFAVPVRASFSF